MVPVPIPPKGKEMRERYSPEKARGKEILLGIFPEADPGSWPDGVSVSDAVNAPSSGDSA
jgi:hypothetical protein